MSLCFGLRRFAVFLVALNAAAASAVEFNVNDKSSSAREIETVEANGAVRLDLSATALNGVTEFVLDLTPFRNAVGETRSIAFEGAGSDRPTSSTLPAAERQSVRLDVRNLRLGEAYSERCKSCRRADLRPSLP